METDFFLVNFQPLWRFQLFKTLFPSFAAAIPPEPMFPDFVVRQNRQIFCDFPKNHQSNFAKILVLLLKIKMDSLTACDFIKCHEQIFNSIFMPQFEGRGDRYSLCSVDDFHHKISKTARLARTTH